MNNTEILMLCLIWFLPVTIGSYWLFSIWSSIRKYNLYIANIYRAFPIALTFTPMYIPTVGFIKLPALLFLLFTPPDTTFLSQAEGAVPPILISWLILTIVFILIEFFIRQQLCEKVVKK